MLLTLALTWVYLPEELAGAATVLAIVLAAASGLTFRADKSFALAGTKEQARVVRISVALHVLVGAALVLSIIISPQLRSHWAYLGLAAAAVIASSFSSIRIGRLLAAGDSASLAWRNLAVPLLTPLGQLGLSPVGGYGAVLGGFAGMYLAAAAMLRLKVRKIELRVRETTMRRRDLLTLAVSGAATPLAILAPTFGLLAGGFAREAGLLTLALRIGGLPATATGPALGQAFVIKRQNGSLRGRHWGLLAAAGSVWSVLLVVGLTVGGDVVLGDSWAGIGAVAVPAALVSCVKVVANPSQALLLAGGRSGLMLALDALRLGGCMAIGLAAAWLNLPFQAAIWSMTGLLVVTYLAYFLASSQLR